MKSNCHLYCTFLAAGLALSACDARKAPPPAPPPKVTISQPQSLTVTNWDEYPGHLEAVESVEVRPRVSGYIESIHFTEGAEVKVGDLLIVIDPKPYQAELDRAAAEARQTETRLEIASNEFKRVEQLRGTKAISEEEYDNRNKAVRQAEAGLAASQAAERVARLNLGYTRITAPVSGKIGRRLVTVGNLVQGQGNSSQPPLATIVSVAPIYCYFDVEESVFVKYRNCAATNQAGDQPGGGLPCELALNTETGFPHKGRLDFFDNQVNPKTGTIRLRAVFENQGRELVPGMFGRMRISAEPPSPALLVPDVAVGLDLGYKFVYLVNASNVVETRLVEAGRAHGALRAVTKGLTPDDRVIVNGLMMLRPGLKVEPQPAATATAAPPAAAAR